jgi:Holliday junction resolvase RusA-like endonuclease
VIEFTIFGRPQQKGSKQPFVNRRKDGSTFAGMKDANPIARHWQAAVSAAAAAAYTGELLIEPVHLDVAFFFSRPRSHYRTGRNRHLLKPAAPTIHANIPDLDKLVRTLADGLQGIVLMDDKQIGKLTATKQWTTSQECAVVAIEIMKGRRLCDCP